MKSETTKVGDLVTLKSSGRVMKVVQIHAKTSQVCVIPWVTPWSEQTMGHRPAMSSCSSTTRVAAVGIWVKLDAIEVPGLRSTNSTLSL